MAKEKQRPGPAAGEKPMGAAGPENAVLIERIERLEKIVQRLYGHIFREDPFKEAPN